MVKRIAYGGSAKMVLCECLSVPKSSANKVLSYLLKQDVVRKDLKIRYEMNHVLIPVKSPIKLDGTLAERHDFQVRDLTVSPVERVNRKLEEMGIEGRFPDKFIMFGDSLFIKEKRFQRLPLKVFGMIAKEFCANSIYLDRGIGESPIREPDVKLLWGRKGGVTHEENGIFYSFDPTKVMFSPGNVNSRIWESKGHFNEKTVVDMFAGIGYFTLQVAKGSPRARIFACELNPNSFDFLVQNIRKNRMEDRINPLPGDCRSSTYGLRADYILMGHFDSPQFLATALRMSHKGTMINMHIICDTATINSHWIGIQRRARELGYLIDILDQKVVKSYGPHLWHVSSRFIVTAAL
jgi:tRNA wybutosine-synthesizing protein 2